MSERDFFKQKVDETWEMIHQDIDGLRNYAQEADAAFKQIRSLEQTLRGQDGKYHGALKHWEKQLDRIFEIAREFER